MDPVSTEPFPPDGEIARRLFSSPPSPGGCRRRGARRAGAGDIYSSHESPSKRDPLHKEDSVCEEDDVWGYKPQSKVTRRKPQMGFCGSLIFLSLCVVALVLTVQFNSWEWRTIASDGKDKCMRSVDKLLSQTLSLPKLSSLADQSWFFLGGLVNCS